jgi:PDZ domain-containing protein
MKTTLTLAALLTFGFVGSLAWAQDEEGEAKKLRRIEPAEKSEAEKSPSSEDIDRRIAALQDELRALDEKRRQLGRELRELRRKRRGRRDIFSALPGLRLRMGGAQGLTMESGPDGVRVQIREPNEQGEIETKVYEAESMEAFRKEHPDLAERYGIGGDFGGGLGFDFRMDRDDLPLPRDFPEMRRSLEELREQLEGMTGGLSGSSSPLFPSRPRAPRRAAPSPRERLGVLVAPIDPERAEELSLESGEGLLVEEVQPKTLAARLGLMRGDVLLTINGKNIEGAATIAETLRELESRDPVTIVVERPGRGRLTLEATKTAPAKATKRV